MQHRSFFQSDQIVLFVCAWTTYSGISPCTNKQDRIYDIMVGVLEEKMTNWPLRGFERYAPHYINRLLTIKLQQKSMKGSLYANHHHPDKKSFQKRTEYRKLEPYAYLQNVLKGDQKQVYLRVKHIQHQRQNLDYHLNVAFISYFKIFIFFLSEIHRLHQSQVIKRYPLLLQRST